jgi:outer membrane biosynthesis protein TonB
MPDPHIPIPKPEPHPVKRPEPRPEPAPQPTPVPGPDSPHVPMPSPAPFPAPFPVPKAVLIALILAFGLGCDDIRLPGSAEPLPRPTPNAAAAGFDGSWRGSFSGTGEIGGTSQPISGPLTFTATSGVVKVSQPSDGAGSVQSSGAIAFQGSMSVSGVPVTCTFTGTLRTAGAMEPGQARCTSLAGSANGTWTAARE